jgi:hypothetical protein
MNDIIQQLKSYDRMKLTVEEAEIRERAAREIYMLLHEVETHRAALKEARDYIVNDSLYFEPPVNLVPRMNDILGNEAP